MRIEISRPLFLSDPTKRFSRKFHCSPNIWKEVWRRYKILHYTEEEAREYLVLTLHIQVSRKRFRRWLYRTETYTRAQIAINEGAKEVKSEYFGPLKEFVEKEVSKNNKQL